jgi:catechol 2,3-dioxygenase-like lactoylglutathione lyase family enzyme
MTLNHLNLAVSDVQEARAFLVEYFGLATEARGNDRIAALRSDNGLVLTLSNFDGVSEVKYPGGFHIGFGLESREKVDELNRRLRDDGYEVEPPGKDHGAWVFFFTAPGGFVIEVGSRP